MFNVNGVIKVDIEKIIKSMSNTQKNDIKTIYKRRRYLIGTGLKTGKTLMKKGLIKLSDVQLSNWTMYKITPLGVEVVEELMKRSIERG